MIGLQTWANRPGAVPPAWVLEQVLGEVGSNGSFLIQTWCGQQPAQARVHPGHVVIECKGKLYCRPPEEVASFMTSQAEAELIARTPTAIGPGKAIRVPSRKVKVAAQARALSSSKTKARPSYPPPLGARPSIEWVPVADLSVDVAYQRRTDNDASRRLITSIAAKFDWRLFGILFVSRRPDGSLKVIDGQHRWTAATMRGDIDQVPCSLSRFETMEEEAKFFIVANRARKPMNKLDDFHAALAAGDDDALEIDTLVRDAGLAVARSPSTSALKPGEVTFTAAIARTIRQQGTQIASAALVNMAEAFHGMSLRAGGAIFNGIVLAITKTDDDFDPDRFALALRKYDADGWASFIEGTKGGSTRAEGMRDAMLMAYHEIAETVAEEVAEAA